MQGVYAQQEISGYPRFIHALDGIIQLFISYQCLPGHQWSASQPESADSALHGPG